MFINLAEIKMNLKKRGEDLEKSPIGSRLKYVRKQLKLTLQESSDEICSVSYLSKIENNLIKPTPRYINKLKEKYHMTDEITMNENYEEILDDMLVALFTNEVYTYDKKTYQDYQEYMLTYCSYVLEGAFDKTKDLFHDMTMFIPNLPNKSLNTLLVMTAHVLYYDGRYSDSKALLELMIDEKNHDMLVLLKEKYLLKNAVKMNQMIQFDNLYQNYINHLIKAQYVNEIPIINLEKSIMYESYMFVDSYITSHRIKKIDEETRDLIYKALLKQQKFQKIIDFTKSSLDDTVNLYYYVISHHHLKNKKVVQKMLPYIHIDRKKYNDYWVIIRHLSHQYLSTKDQKLNYLRNELLGYKHLTDDVTILYTMMMDAFHIFKKYFFYKEATEVVSTFLPKIKQLIHD